jgi:hypothetical protein
MPSPRDTYLTAVVECLQQIRTSNGFLTDIGANVTREPAPKVADDAEFVTVVWGRQDRPADPGLARTSRLTTLQIMAKVPAGLDDAQGRIDEALSDIEQALDGQLAQFPTGYQFPQYQSAEPLNGDAADGWAGVVVTVTGHIPKR